MSATNAAEITPAFTIVQTTRTEIEAYLLIAALRRAGLHPLDLDTASHFSSGGADVAYHIVVPTEEIKAIREFLKSLAILGQ